MDSTTIVVDGYNIIRQVPALLAAEAHSLAAGREALLAQLRATYRQSTYRVLVVFDGAGARQTVAPLHCGVRSQVIFSARGQTADQVILRLVEAECAGGAPVVVATNDLAVRLASQGTGAHTASARDLAGRLNAAPRHLERAARHRAAVRAQLADVSDADDDYDTRRPRKGNPRRAPRRRRGRGQAPTGPL